MTGYGSVLKPHNILKGLTPVIDTFDAGTIPSNPERITDGDTTTVTGEGAKVMGGSGVYGQVIFDLGSIKRVLVSGKVATKSSASTTSVYIESSDDGISYNNGIPAIANVSSTGYVISELRGPVCIGRFIKIKFIAGATSTAYAKIYEILGYDMGV